MNNIKFTYDKLESVKFGFSVSQMIGSTLQEYVFSEHILRIIDRLQNLTSIRKNLDNIL